MSKVSTELKSVVRPTLIFESRRLTEKLGLKSLTFASESLQHTGSFKFRAAYNVVLSSSSRHFAAVSSGNFAQALAYACRLLDRKCTLVMPDTSSKVKVDGVRELGANLELVDTSQKTRQEWLELIVSRIDEPLEIVSPYDDERVIEGNSSLGDEIVEIRDEFDCIIVPVGGGGLSSGIIHALRRHSLPVQVYGAEPQLGNDAARSLKLGRLVANDSEPTTIADGARTLSLGKQNWKYISSGMDSIVEVDEQTIEEALKMLFTEANMKVEPTGALSLGAILTNPVLFASRRPLCIISGGNVDPSLFASIIQG